MRTHAAKLNITTPKTNDTINHQIEEFQIWD
jgi:hypothetical protein